MYDPKEELQAILDLLGEWRNKNGFGYVSMCIMPDGTGCAYDWDNEDKGTGYFTVTGEYGPWKKDPGSGNCEGPRK